MLPPSLQEALEQARNTHQKITLVTGVFDVLHEKHQDFLRDAKALGGFLLVGIEPDLRVKQMKGEDRPYHPQDQRIQNLEELGIADAVFLLPENFGQPEVREALIKEIRPQFLAVSSHSLYQEKKQELMNKYGGQLAVVTQYDPQYSSTKLIQELRKSNK